MHIFKELSFVGDKPALDDFKKNAPSFAKGDWKYCKSDRMRNYIAFDYEGDKAEQAERRKDAIYPERHRCGYTPGDRATCDPGMALRMSYRKLAWYQIEK